MPFKFEKLEVWQLALDYNVAPLRQAYRRAETLAAKLHTMRRAIAPERGWLRESPVEYIMDDK